MELNVKSNSRLLAEAAIVASLYIVLTVFLPILSYGQIQFRISEALLVLVLFRRSSIPGLIIGCLIANLFNPSIPVYDIFFGTAGTALTVWAMFKLRNKPVVLALAPAVFFNAVLVAAELKIALNLPFFLSAALVGAGEALVLYTIGLVLYKILKTIGFKSDYENVLQN